MGELKFYKCKKCGEVFWKVVGAECDCTPSCCGEPCVALVANTVDAAREKLVPALSVEGDRLVARVGEVAHPMLPEHHIAFIALDRGNGKVEVKFLQPGEAPEATFCVPPRDAVVYEYCNLHGLWKAGFTA